MLFPENIHLSHTSIMKKMTLFPYPCWATEHPCIVHYREYPPSHLPPPPPWDFMIKVLHILSLFNKKGLLDHNIYIKLIFFLENVSCVV